MEQTQEMSEYTSTFFQKLMQESKNAENRAAEANDNQINSIIDFQKTYEVIILLHLFKSCLSLSITSMCCVQAQSKSDTEKLIADLTNLVSCHVRRQHELVRCLFFHLFLIVFHFMKHKDCIVFFYLAGGFKTQ